MGKKYAKLEKLTDNPFLNMYKIHARTRSGKGFFYQIREKLRYV